MIDAYPIFLSIAASRSHHPGTRRRLRSSEAIRPERAGTLAATPDATSP
jgi:hypothetical protein